MIALESRIMQQDTELDLIRDELVKAMRLAEQGKHRQTVETCLRTLKTAAQKALPLPEGFVAALLTRMGLSMAAQGEMEQAVLHYRLAEGVLLRRKESVRQVRDRYEVVLYTTEDDLRLLLADIYQALGALYESRQEPDRAITYYRQAYKIAETMESAGLAWRALHAVAQNYQARSMWNDLRETTEELLAINARDPQPSREIIARRFLAQTYGKTSNLPEMLAQLTQIVEIGRSVGHPDLPYDERALMRAQQTLSMRGESGSAIVPAQASPLVASGKDVRSSRSMEIAAVRPGTGALKSTPTAREATEVPTDLIHAISVEQENEHGASEAVFVLQTRYFDHAVSLFQMFRPSVLAINIPGIRQLPHQDIRLPAQGMLNIEWSLHDLKPNVLLCNTVLSDAQVHKLEETNRESRRMLVYLEGKDGAFGKRKRQSLPNLFDPYVLDWRGMTGVVRFLRRMYMGDGNQLNDQDAHHLLTLLQLQVKEGFLATGIYREMGVIYRMVGDTDSGLQCFREEIACGMGRDGIPAAHTAQSFRQMGLLHMERKEDELAFDAVRMALSISPNSFDALTAMGTLLKDPAEALRYLGRAHRIRSTDPGWDTIAKTAAARFNRTPQQIEQAVAIVAVQADLSLHYEFDRSALERLRIV